MLPNFCWKNKQFG